MNLLNYLNHIDAWVIADILIIVAVSFPLLIFFIKKNSLRLAVLLGIYVLVQVAVNLICALTPNNALFISKRICGFYS